MATQIAQGVYWVGVVDWALRNFHGHELSTHRGSTYNSYLILDEKKALVDTVWAPFTDEFIDGLSEVIDPAELDYVVVNHAEPDHSGGLPALMRLCPDATVVASKRGVESVSGHYHEDWNFKAVGTGEKISLGARELTFIEAPMLHWPDTMFTYLSGEAILMSNDGFGQHYASAFRFNDEVDQVELYEEALKYYANILTPYSGQVIKKIDEILEMNIPVSMIAPSHGVIWRKSPLQIVEKYQQWARQEPSRSAVILFDTMWHATRRMAEAIGEGLAARDVDFKAYYMPVSDRNDVLAEVFKAGAVIVGSPTLNNGIMPTIAPIMEDLKGLRFTNKVAAAFGSYGWSGEAVKRIEDHLAECKFDIAGEGVRAKWQPDRDALDSCRALAEKVAGALPAQP